MLATILPYSSRRDKESTRTTKAHPRPRSKRNKLPPHLPPLPPLRPELLDIVPPDVRAVLHRVRRDKHLPALGHENRLFAIRPPSARERGVLSGNALVERDDGGDAEGFVDAVVEVVADAQLGEGEVGGGGVVGAELREDGGAEFGVDGRVARQKVEHPSQQRAGGVAAGEHDAERLVAQLERVLRVLGQFVEQDEFLLHGGVGWLGSPAEADLNEPVDELVHFGAVLVECLGCHEPVPFVKGPARLDPVFACVEMRAQPGAVGAVDALEHGQLGACGRVLGVDAVAVDEFGDGIEGEVVQQGLQVEGRGPAVLGWKEAVGEFSGMFFGEVEVGHLLARELGADQGARVFPLLALGGEDADAEEGFPAVGAVDADVEFRSLGAKNCFDVFGVASHQ